MFTKLAQEAHNTAGVHQMGGHCNFVVFGLLYIGGGKHIFAQKTQLNTCSSVLFGPRYGGTQQRKTRWRRGLRTGLLLQWLNSGGGALGANAKRCASTLCTCPGASAFLCITASSDAGLGLVCAYADYARPLCQAVLTVYHPTLFLE